MLEKEIKDTGRALGLALIVGIASILFTLLIVHLTTGGEFSGNEVICAMIEGILLLVSIYLGSSLFAEEKTQNSFEYLFSLKRKRRDILKAKLIPRLAALLVLLFIYLIFSWLFSRFPLVFGAGIFIPLLFAFFFFWSSLSLLSRNYALNTFYNFIAFFIFNMLVVSIMIFLTSGLPFFWDDYRAIFVISVFIFSFFSLILFVGFVWTFKKIDLSNMTRLFKKRFIARLGLAILAMFAAWIVINLFDSSKDQARFTEKDLLPVSYDRENGYYRLCSLAEPEAVDVDSESIFEKYRQDKFFEQNKVNKFLKAYMTIFSSHQIPLRKWPAEILVKKEEIYKVRDRVQFLLDRYEKLLACPVFADFSPLSVDAQIPNLLQWQKVSNLYLSVNMIEALEGNWQQGIDHILKNIDFCQKVVKGSRQLSTNLFAKGIMLRSLEVLTSLMGHPACPQQIFSQVSAGLPPLDYQDYGTRNCLIADYLIMTGYLGRGFKGSYLPFREKVMRILFYQKNRTAAVIYKILKTVIVYESTPPYQTKINLETELEKVKKETVGGPFWWLSNVMGKVFLKTVGFFNNYHWFPDRSFRLKAIYDMTRIQADFYRHYDRQKTVQENLNSLAIYRSLLDPCSGRPYVYDDKQKVLYSLGTDLKDDGGVEKIGLKIADYVLPLTGAEGVEQ